MNREQQGFTYLGVLILVAILSLALAATGIVWSQAQQRDQERQLLFIGRQFVRAIGSYYNESPGTVKRYPASLEALLEDKRHLAMKRHLRQLYRDPFTRARAWRLVIAPEGGIMGVQSESQLKPIRVADVLPGYVRVVGKGEAYSDWAFVYRPEPDATNTETAAKPALPQLAAQ